jgi:uncharacterized protein YrzB (UPF0473 family)
MSEILNNKHDHKNCHDTDCGCNENSCECNHEHDAEYETIMLTLDDNTELECIVLGIFDIDQKSYIALLPQDQDDVLLYQYSEDGDNIDLTNIEDDEEFDKVSKTFLDLIEQED